MIKRKDVLKPFTKEYVIKTIVRTNSSVVGRGLSRDRIGTKGKKVVIYFYCCSTVLKFPRKAFRDRQIIHVRVVKDS